MLGFAPSFSAPWPVEIAEAVFVALLAAAAVSDMWNRRIPNIIPLLLAVAFPVALAVIGLPPDWLFHVLGAGVVLALGVVLFHRGLLGGGDVKLLAAATLWYGVDRLPIFVFAVSIAGGALGLLTILARLARNVIPSLASRGTSSRSLRGTELPYGVAIAVGGIIVRPILGI
jgi:prepilin peptidase CpaA